MFIRMLDLNDIKQFYSKNESKNQRHIFREYLQYKILDALYDSPIANKISFLGGTAIRFIHGSSRFSEDLDFDNFDLNYEEFIESSKYIKRKLELDGFVVEIRNIKIAAFHCYVKFPDILYQNKLTPIKSEKILIQVDTMAHGFDYKPDVFLMNKFGLTKNISKTPVDILLSQKISAVFNRKRTKGRDFFDISYLMAITKPNYDYLKSKLDISDADNLKNYLLDQSKDVDFKMLAKDVEPFLIDSDDTNKVLLFMDIVKNGRF